MRKRTLLTVVLSILVLGVLFYWPRSYLPDTIGEGLQNFRGNVGTSFRYFFPESEQSPDESQESFSVAVDAVAVDRRDIDLTLKHHGTFVPKKQIKVSSQKEGRIKRLTVDHVGTRVSKGETLAVLERSRQDIQQARAEYTRRLEQLRFTQQRYWNQLQLHEADAITQQELRTVAQERFEAASKLLSVKLELEALRNNVVRAPADGRIAGKHYSEGDVVESAGKPILTLVTQNAVYFQAEIPETQLSKVRRGQSVLIDPAAYPSKTFRTTVESLSPTVSPGNRSFSVLALLENPEKRLKPGMSGKIRLVTETREDVLALPRKAVVYTPEQKNRVNVFVVKEGVALEKSIRINGGNDRLVHVTEGLSEGDRVVLTGQDRLQDLVKVDAQIVDYPSESQ